MADGKDVKRKQPIATHEKLEAIASEFPTPFHLYSEAGIRRRVESLLEAFSWNPGYREYFAVKATPNPAIIEILREYGCGVDCATGVELMLARALGMSGEEIMFSSNETPADDYRLAAELGAITNLDDITQLANYERAAGSFPSAMCVRYNPGGTFEFGNGIMGNPGAAKYGMTRPQLFEALQALASKGVSRLGIHAFLASNTTSNDYYPALARTLFELAVQLKDETGISVSFVNLSGGVGVAYHPDEPECDIATIGEGVHRAFEDVLLPADMDDVSIFTELGRWVMAPNGNLVTRVIGEKHTYRDYVGVDASAADLMRPMIYGAYHHITLSGHEEDAADHIYDVVGGLCENTDKFAEARELPEVHLGDLLVIHDTGAHGHSMGYNYNGKLRHAELLLREDGTVSLIRRAETPADYFATLDVLDVGKHLLERGTTWI